MSASDVVRQYFAAYETKDRKSLESLLTDDFTFSSPLDDCISRARYFKRCWPNSEHLRAFHIEKVLADGDDAIVTYEGERTDGAHFRNAEFFQLRDGKVQHVDVYFGTEKDLIVDEH